MTRLAVFLLLAGCATAPNRLLVASHKDAALRIVDPDARKVLSTLPTGAGPGEVAVAPGGKVAVVSNYQEPGSLTVISLEEHKVLRTLGLGPHQKPHGLSFLPDGRLAVTSEGNQALLLVDITDGRIDKVINTNAAGSHMVVTSPDGTRAWTANGEAGSVTLLDLEKGRPLKTVDVAPEVEAIALSPDARELWVGGNDGNRLKVLDAETLEVRAQVPVAGKPERITITPDGQHAVVSFGVAGKVQIIETARRVVVGTIDFPQASARPLGSVVTPDSRTAYVSLSGSGEIAVVDLTSRSLSGMLQTGDSPDGIALVPR